MSQKSKTWGRKVNDFRNNFCVLQYNAKGEPMKDKQVEN